MKNQYQDNDTLCDESDEMSLPATLTTLSSVAMNALYHQTKRIMGKMVDYKELRMIYACAMKEIKTKFEILNTEFNLQYHRNPINSIQTRLKSTASIIEKLANGIGLAIVKSIVELHKGEVSVNSGNGITTFTVVLPKKQ